MNTRLKENLNRLRYVLLGGTCAAAISMASLQLWAEVSQPRQTKVEVNVDNRPLEREGDYFTSFAPVVQRVAPSVVKVYTVTKGREVQMQGSPFGNHPFFREFFGDRFNGNGEGRTLRQPDRSGLGSGVIVSEDGYILTNNHVVENADEIKVAVSPDDREFDAEVIGRDPKSDIAVLKIKGESLPAITLGDSDAIMVGDLALAVGNPFGIGQTVTMGMVSATGRASMGLDYEDFIQTDAAINPGNSGGALVDINGRLIGINTAILSRSGGNNGIGFAVPVNMARAIMESLVEHGRVVRGFLGVNIQNVNSELAAAFDLEEARGALVAQVTPDSPADKAGIQSGDVIVELDKKPIKDSRQLKLAVGASAPGTELPVKVIRDGKAREFKVTLTELDGGEQLATNRGTDAPEDTERLKGVAVTDLDSAARQQLEVPKNVKGALVTNVDPTSPAYEAGLRQGDVILELDRKPVNDAEDAVELSKNIERDRILLRVWSRGASRFIVVDESRMG